MIPLTKTLIDDTYETANHALELMKIPHRVTRQDVVIILVNERIVLGIAEAREAV